MQFTSKLIWFFATLLIATQAISSPTYPEKPIKIIMGFPAGGRLTSTHG